MGVGAWGEGGGGDNIPLFPSVVILQVRTFHLEIEFLIASYSFVIINIMYLRRRRIHAKYLSMTMWIVRLKLSINHLHLGCQLVVNLT